MHQSNFRPIRKIPLKKDDGRFYWFSYGSAVNFLYGANMGEPLAFGAINIITSYLSGTNPLNVSLKDQENFLLYYYNYTPEFRGGWKQSNAVPLSGYNQIKAEKTAKNIDVISMVPTMKNTDYAGETIFFYFEFPNLNCILYDHKMGTPVQRSNKIVMGKTINEIAKKLPITPTISYFKLDTKFNWKCFLLYKPTNNGAKKVEEDDAKGNLKYKKEEDKSKT